MHTLSNIKYLHTSSISVNNSNTNLPRPPNLPKENFLAECTTFDIGSAAFHVHENHQNNASNQAMMSPTWQRSNDGLALEELAFHRCRSNSPLGGKSFHRIKETKQQPSTAQVDTAPATLIYQLLRMSQLSTTLFMKARITPRLSQLQSVVTQEPWNLCSAGSNAGSSLPSAPAVDPIEFDESQTFSHDALLCTTPIFLQ